MNTYKNTLNKINLTIKNLTLWQFVVANFLLAIAFFFSRIFANEITGTIYLFLFLILPMIGVVLAIKNIKNNYNLLIGIQFFAWFCGLSILNYLDKRFLTLDFDLFIYFSTRQFITKFIGHCLLCGIWHFIFITNKICQP